MKGWKVIKSIFQRLSPDPNPAPSLHDRIAEHDDERILSDITGELRWCEKETQYLVGGSNHPHAEWRIKRIRSALEDIDTQLTVLEERATKKEEE